MHLANYQSAFAGSTFAFDQTFTRANYLTADSVSGNSVAAMLLGAATSGGVDYIARPYYSWRYYAPWVQDDIKVLRRLTLNIGLRWDVLGPLSERYNRLNYGFFPDPKRGNTMQFRSADGLSQLQGQRRHRLLRRRWKSAHCIQHRLEQYPTARAAFQLTPTLFCEAASVFPISRKFLWKQLWVQPEHTLRRVSDVKSDAGRAVPTCSLGTYRAVGASQGLSHYSVSSEFRQCQGSIGYVYSYLRYPEAIDQSVSH
jgi:hypothetical protein